MTGVVVNAIFSVGWLWLMTRDVPTPIVLVRACGAIGHAVMAVLFSLSL